MGLSPSELLARIADGEAFTILDVRSHDEFAQGHVPGAIHVPFLSVTAEVADMLRLKATATSDRGGAVGQPGARGRRDGARPVVVYCGHGPRAWYAAAMLRRHGVAHVSCLDGHMSRWRREGCPEER